VVLYAISQQRLFLTEQGFGQIPEAGSELHGRYGCKVLALCAMDLEPGIAD